MKTVKNIEFTTIINKSKFITNLFFVTSIDEVNTYLANIKKKYNAATHHCFAYILDNVKRFNDDKEPNGTAGKPILECLEKNSLNYVLCIVTRCFGGIKLGSGGLIRAYSNSVMNAINNTIILDVIKGYNADILFSYTETNGIDKLLSKYEIIEKKFEENIIYNANIDDELLNILKSMNVEIRLKKEIFITK